MDQINLFEKLHTVLSRCTVYVPVDYVRRRELISNNVNTIIYNRTVGSGIFNIHTFVLDKFIRTKSYNIM